MKDVPVPDDDVRDDDIPALVSHWADETKRLFLLLPRLLAESKDQKAALQLSQQRVAELEQENEQLRQSRAALADLYTRFKQLVEGYANNGAPDEGPAQRPTEPQGTAAPTTEAGGRRSSIFHRPQKS